MRNNSKIKLILSGIFFLFITGLVCYLTYIANYAPNLEDPLEYTMMLEHKPTETVTLSQETPQLNETFICPVDQLKTLDFQCRGTSVHSETILNVSLTNADTQEEYINKNYRLQNIAKSSVSSVTLRLDPVLDNAKGARLRLSLTLKKANETILSITSNAKYTLVESFNDITENKTNIIYHLTYGTRTSIYKLYLVISVALICFLGLCYFLFILKKKTLLQSYWILVIIFGTFFNIVFTVHGIPDEPGHIDTAYYYSNKMLSIGETEIPGTIYKRTCDVEMSELLAYGLESNSYHQMKETLFTKPANTELIAVPYSNVAHIVPSIVFLPSAAGISVGRLLGLSFFMTIMLGRTFNLFIYAFLCWFALRLIPFGKSAFGMITLLPISLQQAASISYDAIIIGYLFLFIAVVLKMAADEHIGKLDISLAIILSALIFLTKGGVYTPLFLLFILVFKKHHTTPFSIKIKVAASITALALFSLFFVKFMPLLKTLLGDTADSGAVSYSVSYFLQNPGNFLAILWRTVQNMDPLLSGILGGKLSWLDVEANWYCLIILLIGLMLLANEKSCHKNDRGHYKTVFAASSVLSMFLIILSMLLTYTAYGAMNIGGVQGRYFLPLLPLLIFCCHTNMVTVTEHQANKLYMVMFSTESLILLQAFACI